LPLIDFFAAAGAGADPCPLREEPAAAAATNPLERVW
jgi:hypothetical protein